MSFTFDGINKTIQLNTTSSFEVTEMYSRWKDWVLVSDNAKFLQAFRFVGGDPTVGGKSLGITYFLTNNWVIQPFAQDHRLQVVGNLFTDNGDSPFIAASGSFNVLIESEVSNINTAEAVPNATQQSLEYGNQVILDPITGTAGTIYPIGLGTSPVDNIDDAVTLTTTYGLDTIKVCGSITITSGSNISNKEIEGKNKNIKITLDNCIANNTTFKNIILTGNAQ